MGIGIRNTEILKRLASAVLAGAMLFGISSCGKSTNTITETTSEALSSVITTVTGTFGFEDEPEENSSEHLVDNEEHAQRVLTCSHRNLFGLEKVVLFENRLTAVFDKNTNDKSGGFLGKGNEEIDYLWFSFNNLSAVETQFDVSEIQDKYILDAVCHYEESDLIDPSREVKIIRCFVRGNHDSMNIVICGDDLEIMLYKDNFDSHSQYYDASEKKWADVKTNIHERNSSSSDEGISISYELGMLMDASYEYEIDAISYKIDYYGRYLNVIITNNGNETKVIGGTRYLQRVDGDALIDLSRDNREMTVYEGKVKELPIVKIWSFSSSDPDQHLHRSPDPGNILKENETYELMPGEYLYAEILVYDFDIDKDGIYRLTFGDAELDFELEWKMIW